MTRQLISKKEGGVVAPALLILGLLVVGAVAVFVFNRAAQEKASQPGEYRQPIAPQPLQSGFEARKFYDQIEDGMDLSQLDQLAGKTGACTTTGVYPAPKTTPCYWSDGSYIVQVTLGSGKVVSKSLQENKADSTN